MGSSTLLRQQYKRNALFHVENDEIGVFITNTCTLPVFSQIQMEVILEKRKQFPPFPSNWSLRLLEQVNESKKGLKWKWQTTKGIPCSQRAPFIIFSSTLPGCCHVIPGRDARDIRGSCCATSSSGLHVLPWDLLLPLDSSLLVSCSFSCLHVILDLHVELIQQQLIVVSLQFLWQSLF